MCMRLCPTKFIKGRGIMNGCPTPQTLDIKTSSLIHLEGNHQDRSQIDLQPQNFSFDTSELCHHMHQANVTC